MMSLLLNFTLDFFFFFSSCFSFFALASQAGPGAWLWHQDDESRWQVLGSWWAAGCLLGPETPEPVRTVGRHSARREHIDAGELGSGGQAEPSGPLENAEARAAAGGRAGSHRSGKPARQSVN